MAATVWTFGPGGEFTASWDGVSVVTITATSGGGFLGSFTGATSLTLAQALATGFVPPAAPPALSLVATTGPAGFVLQNATPTILTWTAPNDGNAHYVFPFGNVHVSTTEPAGDGAITGSGSDPGGNSISAALDAGGHGAGTFSFNTKALVIGPGTTFTLTQTAISTGAAVLYASLFAS